MKIIFNNLLPFRHNLNPRSIPEGITELNISVLTVDY